MPDLLAADFSFIARRAYSPEDAQDLTQDFFVRILKGDWLQKADPARGRFRSLLLKSLQNFLNDAVDRRNSRKRGGEISFISWDSGRRGASTVELTEEALRSWPAERVFDASWAATTAQRALFCSSAFDVELSNVLPTDAPRVA